MFPGHPPPQVFWKEEKRTRCVRGRRKLPAPTPYFLSQLIRGHGVGAIPLQHYLRNHIPSSPDTIATPPPRAATPPAQSLLLSRLPPTVLPSPSPPPAAFRPWAPVPESAEQSEGATC